MGEMLHNISQPKSKAPVHKHKTTRNKKVDINHSIRYFNVLCKIQLILVPDNYGHMTLYHKKVIINNIQPYTVWQD